MWKIPRISASVVNQLRSPVVNQLEPPVINTPRVAPPVINGLAPPIVDVPSYNQPTYTPPNFVEDPVISNPALGPVGGGGKEESEEEENSRELPDTSAILPDPTVGRPVVEIPIVGEIPLPTTSEVGLAGTTAVAATAAALFGKSLVEQLLKIFKPIAKKLLLKIKEKRGKQFTDYELQQYFEFEGKTPEMKPVAKRLQAELKAEKQRQLAEHLQRQRQNKQRHKESQGGNKSPASQPPRNGEV